MSDVIFIFHFGLFLPFYPSNSLKKENLKKKKEKNHKKQQQQQQQQHGDIIILHKRTKNHDHMLYCS